MHACNVGVLEFAVTGLYVTIWFFFIKALMTRYPDSQLSKSLAFIFQ